MWSKGCELEREPGTPFRVLVKQTKRTKARSWQTGYEDGLTDFRAVLVGGTNFRAAVLARVFAGMRGVRPQRAAPRAGVLALSLACALGGGCDQKSPRDERPAAAPSSAQPVAESAQQEKKAESSPSSPSAPRAAAEKGSSPSKPAAYPATDPAPKRRYVVAALGDSITDARSGGGGYLKVLKEACPESTFLNFGKGGDMTNQMRKRLERDIVPRVEQLGIDTLLVYGGVNDLYSDLSAGRTNDKIEEDLSRIYQKGRENGLRIVAVTVSPWGGFDKYFNARRGQNTLLLNSWILGQAQKGLVDEAVDSYPALSCGDPQKLCREYQTRYLDGLHPGKKGHEILGEKLLGEAFSDCR